MIKDIMQSNNTIIPGIKELDTLRENVLVCFHAAGYLDIERFREYLKDKVEISDEDYELHSLGKNYADMFASLDTTTVIVPDEAHNNLLDNNNSKNICNSGNNLDAFKHLFRTSRYKDINVHFYTQLNNNRMFQIEKSNL